VSQELYDELQAVIGEKAGPFESKDEVNRAMIRHWCEAMEDGNPIYTDEEYARTSEYGGIIAPPQMVQAYSTPPLWPKQAALINPQTKALEKLNQAGYTGVVATTTSQEYFHPMRIGDSIFYELKLSSVSPEKTTRLGKGHFVTTEYTYTNQDGKLVCIQSFTVLKYMPTPMS